MKIDKKQDFEPKLKSRIHKCGKIESPELYDIQPFLNKEEINKNLISKSISNLMNNTQSTILTKFLMTMMILSSG